MMIVPSIDIYITSQCNLRCEHCFVGNNLTHQGGHFPDDSLHALLRTCTPRWGTQEVTFLGGEPTLHPGLPEALSYSHRLGLRTRVITNGQAAFGRFVDTFDDAQKPSVGFSIDGSSAAVHDAIRGPGSFARVITNVRLATSRGYQCHAILSVSRKNANDVVAILSLAADLQLRYVNVHYVTARGFATSDVVLSVGDWMRLGREIENVLPSIGIPVRLERTFVPGTAPHTCAVREESSLLFFPDGRVFMCPMFVDVAGAHAFEWNAGELLPNSSAHTERTIAAENPSRSCPAMKFVNAEVIAQAELSALVVGCIFDKERLTAPRKVSV
jgi:MoaA/NifB/PqqE/SkfB family radical SAM enzyme